MHCTAVDLLFEVGVYTPPQGGPEKHAMLLRVLSARPSNP